VGIEPKSVLYLTLTSPSWKDSLAIKSLRDMFTKEARLDVTVVDGWQKIPEPIIKNQFDLILLSPMFLCARYTPDLLEVIKVKFDFVSQSRAIKIAMPQDDYDCSEILDSWLYEWGVDVIYSVCPENWNLLYPKCSSEKDIRLGYTGYILDNQMISLGKTKRWSERTIDVSYRASKLSYNFGELGQLKSEIPSWFARAAGDLEDLNVDIQIGEQHFINGKKWYKFLESSRYVLMSPSGSSVIDPTGDLRELASEVAGLDVSISEFFDLASKRKCRWHEMPNTMISPRSLEAALSGAVQIAIESAYSGLLVPGVDYIPLSLNLPLKESLSDQWNWENIRSNAFEKIVSERRLRAHTIINEILDDVGSVSRPKRALSQSVAVGLVVRLHLYSHYRIKRTQRAYKVSYSRLIAKLFITKFLIRILRKLMR
jgi:hypothetical protein